jgi:hypothetical protein
MSNYTKTTNFLAKDSLPENDSGKIIKGSEFDTEFNALQTSVNTKADLASPALTGVPTSPTASPGTNTTQVATTAFVTAADTAILAANNTFTGTQTFKDNKFEVVDDGDATKKLTLQLSGITTATTRTLTVPDKSGTIATTADLTLADPLNAAANTVVSGSYAATSSTTITITATNTFTVGQTVFIQFTNTSGSSLTNGNFTIVTAAAGNFTITYGSSVTSAGTCITTRYGIIALATSTDLSARTDTLRAVSSSNLTITRATAVTSTSGASIDFTSIPAWVKRITLMFNGVSTTSSSPVMIQLGTGGSPETSGYVGTSARYANGNITSVASIEAAGFDLLEGSSSDSMYGAWVFTNITGNTWVCSANISRNTSTMVVVTGSKALSSVLNMLRITTVLGTSAFDAGSVNIMYE